MCPVWRPVTAPPQLQHFCHMSDDAQLVMAGIYRQYNEQRKQLTRTTQTQEHPGTYYQQMYESRFGSSPGVVVSSSQTGQTASIMPGPSSSTFDSRRTDFDSLPNQLERRVCGKSNARSVRGDNNDSLIENSQSSTRLVSESSRNSGVTDSPINMEQPHDALPITTFEDYDAEMSFQQEKCDSWRCENPTFKSAPLLGNNEKCCSSNAGNKSAVHAGDFNITSENKLGTASLGSPSCTIDKRQDEQSQVTNTAPVKKKSATGPVHGTSSISARLKQHMTIRRDIQMKQDKREYSKRQSGELINPSEGSTMGCLDTNRKCSSSQFITPFKKQKKDVDDQVAHEVVVKTSEMRDVLPVRRQNPASVVTTLSDRDLGDVLRTLLSTPEVLISLVYKNGSTQLRDVCTAQTKRKSTGNFRLQQWTSEVHYVAVCGCEGAAGLSQEAKVWLFPLPGQNHKNSCDLRIREFWKDLLSNQHRKICCDAKMLLIILMRNFSVNDTKDVAVFDPVVAAWLLDPDCENVTFQKSLSLVCLTWKEHVLSSAVDVLREDMCLLSELMKRLYQKLIARDLWDLYCCVEMKLLPLLAAMELRSLRVDADAMLRFSDILKRKLQKLEQNAHEAAGHPFLINSPAQLRQVLFEELKLDKKLPGDKRLAKTNIGHQISTSESVLSQLVGTHCLPAIILEYRQVQKLKSTYVDGMMSCVQDGYISTHWDQTSAATGRLSSYQPNIQAIPKTCTVISDYHDNYIVGKVNGDTVEIFARDSFISHDGWSFLAADFQQMELRLLAHLADDPTLLKIFTDSESGSADIFVELTSQWLCKSVSLVTTQEREQTKRVVYSVMYGAGKERLADYLKMSSHDAKAIIDSFLVKFPAVNQFSRKCVEFCQKNGFTTTIFKRRRLIPNIKSSSPVLRAQAERQAVNFCVQGSAADLCKAAMIQVEHTLQSHAHLNARLVVQIHDELLLEVSDEDLNAIRSLVQSVMEDEVTLCGKMVSLKVPIKVSLSTGKTWGHLSPLDSGKF